MAQNIKPQIVWTEEKINLLKEEYPLGDKTLLAEKLGIKRQTLKAAAGRFKVVSLKDQNNYRLKNLFNETPESYYWHGFILADGSIDKKCEIRLSLSRKDKGHLEIFKTFIGCDNKIRDVEADTTYGKSYSSSFACCDAFFGKKFLEQYKIIPPKTFNPPDLSFLNDKVKFLSFFLGFFDGDGCFDMANGHPSLMKIEIHSSWFEQLKFIENNLRKYLDIDSIQTIINKRGFAQLRLYKQASFKKIKQFALDNNLPILLRKWDKVDLNYTPRKHRVQNNFELITELKKQGMSWKEVAIKIDIKSQSNLKRSYEKLKKSLDNTE